MRPNCIRLVWYCSNRECGRKGRSNGSLKTLKGWRDEPIMCSVCRQGHIVCKRAL